MAKYTLLTNLQVAGDFVARSATIGRMEKLLPLGEVCGDAPSGESVTMGGVPGGCVITRVVCVVRNSFASDTKLELGTGAEPSCIAGADDIRCTVPGAYQKKPLAGDRSLRYHPEKQTHRSRRTGQRGFLCILCQYLKE